MTTFSDDYEDLEGDCPNCGGEGFYYDCDDPGACANPDDGCEFCMRRCDWCRQ